MFKPDEVIQLEGDLKYKLFIVKDVLPKTGDRIVTDNNVVLTLLTNDDVAQAINFKAKVLIPFIEPFKI